MKRKILVLIFLLACVSLVIIFSKPTEKEQEATSFTIVEGN